MSVRHKEARRTGHGFISIAGAKLWFIVTSYAVQLLLPRILRSAESFGLYSATLNVVSILNNVLVVATIQSVSKLVSEHEERAGPTLRQGLRIQLVVGGVLAGSLFAVAPVLASNVLLDPQLAPLLRTAAVVVFSYALYATFVGSLNGQHLFQRQAGLDVIFSVLRTTGILTGAAVASGLLVWTGVEGGPNLPPVDGALGAVRGFASASVCIVVAALLLVGSGSAGQPWPVRRWVALMLPLWAYHFCLNGVLQIDLAVLKRTVAELGMGQGMSPVDGAALASRYAGYYRAAQTFAFVPYQLLLSLTFVVFPAVSRATSTGDQEQARRTIAGALRFSMLVLLAIAAPIAGAADGVMRVAYPEEYLAGSGALAVLVFGMAPFGLFVVATTALSGAGRPALAAMIAFVSLVVVVVANRVFVLHVGLGDDTLRAAALGTTLGTTTALVIVAVAVYKVFHTFVPWRTCLRGLVAAAVAFFVSTTVPHGTAFTALLALAAGFFAFLGALVVVREVGSAELQQLRSLLRRGQS